MGIFLDTVEDNTESEGWRIDSIRQKLGILPSTPRQFGSVSCLLCQQLFFTDKDLQNHIFNEHRDYYSYSRSSNRIIAEGKQFTKKDIQKLSYTDLDNTIFNLQARIDKGNHIDDWVVYKNPLYSRSEHPLRKRYLRGMLEYLGTHYQEINEQSTNYQSLSEQCGRAYGYLQPFPLPLAQQVCYSVAFKMNWFEQLIEAPDHSLFFWVGHFFIRERESIISVALPPAGNRQSQGIILDYFHQEFLEAIRLYYCDRSSLNYGWLKKLEDMLHIKTNRNYSDKLDLLKARLFWEWGDIDRARQAYHSIRNHITFGREASSL